MNSNQQPPAGLPPEFSTKHRTLNWTIGVTGILVFVVGIFLLRLEFTVAAQGFVYQQGEMILFAPRDGRIERVMVREGQEVEQGAALFQYGTESLQKERTDLALRISGIEFEQRLVEFAIEHAENTPERAQIQQAPERLELLQEILQMREDTIQRFEGLDAIKAISGLQLQQEKLNQLHSQIEILQTQYLAGLLREGYFEREKEQYLIRLERLEVEKKLLQQKQLIVEQELEASTVRAPFDGRITRLDYRYDDQTVTAGAFLGRISNPTNPFRVRAFAPQRNIDLVRVGQVARMESAVFDSPLEGYIYGTIIEVSPEPHREQSDRMGELVYEIKIEVEETPVALVLGSAVEVEVILGERSIWNLLLFQRPEPRSSFHSEVSQ